MVSPLMPTMVFIHDVVFSASLSQNTLRRVRAGNEVGIAFDGIPGHIVKGKGCRRDGRYRTGAVAGYGNLLNRKTAARSMDPR